MTDEPPLSVALENRLMSHGIYLQTLEPIPPADGAADQSETSSDRLDAHDGIDVRLEYETVAQTDRVTSTEVGAVIRTLRAVAAEREWTPGRLEASSLTTDGDRRGTWHVEAAWFDRLHEGLTELEFSQLVLETINASTETR
ncbi:hypothetical protein [Natronolimnobius baerhuensis]|uniref:DUF8159 domain-containing protein n=1 Tax=Natronolimnobius baerhuensis TaxID=253108 RepID=A0A202EBC8_9EURY|nr:hypothetical protein [Natronolimnobius baerhuensis]OVE85593.1 hypothetical protein B2G88_01850 [Natronolimnobius baerhuensis]